MNKKGKGGFGDRPIEVAREQQSKGGKAKNSKKGFGSMPKRLRKKIAREGVNKRWENYRKEKNGRS